MEKTVRQAGCPAPQRNSQQSKLIQLSPYQAPQSAARMQAVNSSSPRGSRPIVSPLGTRLVTKDVHLQAFPNLPPGSTLSFSRALWIWAKGQVLASLRPSQGPTKTPPTSSHADGTTGEAISTPTAFRGLCCLPPNPSHTHQALHRELLLTHRKGLSLQSKPELLRVLEKRQGQPGAGPGPEPTPLQEVLHRRQQRQQKKQQEETKSRSQDEQLEFMRIRERLRHQPPPQPPSP